MPSQSNEPAVPGRLRVADVDMDGYPDITMTLSFKKSDSLNSQTFSETTILLNESGDDGKRSFGQITADGNSHLSAVVKAAGTKASFMSFIDLDDDGKLDFIL